MNDQRWLIFGLGYSGRAIAAAAARLGCEVAIVSRGGGTPPAGVSLVLFGDAAAAIGRADCILSTAPPGPDGDPVLLAHGTALAAASARWLGYLSSTAVYGDRQGGWATEATPPRAESERARRRLAAEAGWAALAGPGSGRSVDLLRLGGIYGPGRSAFDDLRAGTARRVDKPGHLFSRIHRDDIAGAALAAAATAGVGEVRVLNLVDAEPAEARVVVEEAARLLGMAPPPLTSFAEAWAGMSPMGRSFWSDDRKVSSEWTCRAIARRWRYPSWREGLLAVLAEERAAPAARGGPPLPS